MTSNMEMNTYQKEAKATAIYPNDGNITYLHSPFVARLVRWQTR